MVIYMALKPRDYVFLPFMALGEDQIWLIIYLQKQSQIDQPIKVFNNGEMERDFTYIDDIVNGVTKIIEKNIDSREHYKIYNIGNNKTESLQRFYTTY